MAWGRDQRLCVLRDNRFSNGEQDPALLEATASEPLTLDEELDMQRDWRDDADKCTFIVLARERLEEWAADGDDPAGVVVPPPPADSESDDENVAELQQLLPPRFIGRTLDAMIGDVNLFLTEEGEDEEEPSEDGPGEDAARTTPRPQAELDVMIADASFRRRNLGAELALTMMHYGATRLRVRRFFVKIHENNRASLRLFEKVGFSKCAYAACFGEHELECRRETPEEMAAWVEGRWRRWRRRDDDAEGGGPEEEERRRPCRMYDTYRLPL